MQGRTVNQEEYRQYAEGFAAEFMRAHPELQEARRTASADAYSKLLEQCYWCESGAQARLNFKLRRRFTSDALFSQRIVAAVGRNILCRP